MNNIIPYPFKRIHDRLFELTIHGIDRSSAEAIMLSRSSDYYVILDNYNPEVECGWAVYSARARSEEANGGMSINVGWVQAASGLKYHFLIKLPNGWNWTACGLWGKSWVKEDSIVDNPLQKKRCKLCIRALESSTSKVNTE